MAQAARKLAEGLGRKIKPMFDRVLIEKAEAITKTKGGIYIPEKAQGKVLQGIIVAVGPGGRNEKGDHVPMAVSVGDQVLLPEYGGSKIDFEDKELYLYREHDILAKLSE